MYRSKQDIIDALIEGKTNIHSVRTQASKYRLKKEFATTMMFVEAAEEYKMFYEDIKDEENKKKCTRYNRGGI